MISAETKTGLLTRLCAADAKCASCFRLPQAGANEAEPMHKSQTGTFGRFSGVYRAPLAAPQHRDQDDAPKPLTSIDLRFEVPNICEIPRSNEPKVSILDRIMARTHFVRFWLPHYTRGDLCNLRLLFPKKIAKSICIRYLETWLGHLK